VCGRERDVSMFDGFEIGATLEVEEVKPMNDEDSQLFVTVLKEIRDNQKLQLDRQAEAIALQREQFALVQRQAERHERIQDRAENIQARSAQVMAVARKTLFFVLPIVTLLIVYVSWLIFRLLIR
jgi:Flp pilus assembly protein TadB